MNRNALLAATLISLASSQLAFAQSDLKSQEQWLRYSNWEHRASRPGTANKSTESPEPVQHSKAQDSSESSSKADLESRLPLPERPGSQTVEGGQFTIPGWAFQQPQQAQRPMEIIVGQPLGMRPSFQSRLGYYAGNGFCGMGSGGFFAGGGYYGGRRGCFGQSRLGPQVIQTGPSHPSGNYYQPSTGDPGSSGSYYASGAPWQVPINAPVNNTGDYWGPAGNPFK